jgi:hypothetical protein
MNGFRRVIRIGLALGTLACGTAGITAVWGSGIAYADKNGCSANVQNAHWSTTHGSGGIDLTATWTCSNTSTIILNPTGESEGYLVIWGCGQTKPQPEYTYVIANCSPDGVNSESPFTVDAGDQVSRTAPPLADPPLSGVQWWIGSVSWESQGPDGTATTLNQFGNAAEGFTAP